MIKIKELKTNLLGREVSTNSSNRGRQVEHIMRAQDLILMLAQVLIYNLEKILL